MFGTRLRSSIILVLLTLVTVISGGNILFLTIAAVSVIGMSELYKVMDINNSLPGGIGYLAALIYYALLYFQKAEYMQMLFVLFLMVLMAAYVITFPKYSFEQVMCSFFGLFYVAVLLSFLYQLRIAKDGAFLVWLIFLSSWGCDTCAYCVGMLFGKHKMAPVLSPKKSIEGAVGGIVGAIILGVVYGTVFKGQITGLSNPVVACAIICGVGSVISQIGDLAASAIKRNHDIKDYGKLIPGHGGVLDRFDSVILTAPVIYFVATMLK